jgi:hypothetical protein
VVGSENVWRAYDFLFVSIPLVSSIPNSEANTLQTLGSDSGIDSPCLWRLDGRKTVCNSTVDFDTIHT